MLDYCVIRDIQCNSTRENDVDDLATHVCEKWKIDHVKDIRAVYKAIKEAHPYMPCRPPLDLSGVFTKKPNLSVAK